MTTGVTLVALGWLGAARADYLEEQVPYLISGGLLGVLLGTIGALCLVAHWLAEQLRETRAHEAAHAAREEARREGHAALLTAVVTLTDAVDRLSDAPSSERPARRMRR